MIRPFKNKRPFGPFITGKRLPFSSSGVSRDWQSMSKDELDAPSGWDWQIDDELAHYVWQSTIDSRFVGFGPEPPILLEASMGFFGNKSLSDNINNWYFTRKEGQSFDDPTTWWQIGRKFDTAEGDPGRSDILYSTDTNPHPLRSKLHGQQYTSNGGMFTYDFEQWQGEEPTGMMRIPVTRGLLDELRDDIDSTPFEQFQMQFRTYRGQFADGPAPTGDFAHPHFRPYQDTTQEDYKELFDIAFDYMKRSVRMENSNM
ncbi:MAG: hypothetical protein J07AB43_02720 [Candidatus Nanosalina sp. J07AB43]|nr:MAG: hypothetical protein J07AB43_02720 [Candidatus Nanosalina sp. J07AB43]